MRNAHTEYLGEKLTKAFIKSGMSPVDFMSYLNGTREIHSIESDGDYHSFSVLKGSEVYDYYYIHQENTWSCKC